MAVRAPVRGPLRMVELCVATDLSPAAESAVALSFAWARAPGAGLVLLHVVHDPELAPALANDAPGDMAAARQQLAALAAANADVRCRVDVRAADDVVAAIVAAAAKADYLFVGSHGRTGFQRLRLGSVATAVLQRSHVPVVCLPPARR